MKVDLAESDASAGGAKALPDAEFFLIPVPPFVDLAPVFRFEVALDADLVVCLDCAVPDAVIAVGLETIVEMGTDVVDFVAVAVDFGIDEDKDFDDRDEVVVVGDPSVRFASKGWSLSASVDPKVSSGLRWRG